MESVGMEHPETPVHSLYDLPTNFSNANSCAVRWETHGGILSHVNNTTTIPPFSSVRMGISARQTRDCSYQPRIQTWKPQQAQSGHAHLPSEHMISAFPSMAERMLQQNSAQHTRSYYEREMCTLSPCQTYPDVCTKTQRLHSTKLTAGTSGNGSNSVFAFPD